MLTSPKFVRLMTKAFILGSSMLAGSKPVLSNSSKQSQASPPLPSQKEVDKMLKHLDKLWKSKTSYTEVSMVVHTKNYKRKLTFNSWSKNSTHSLVLIKSPEREKGIATLKIEEDMINYLPNIGRTQKITGPLRNNKWMGSHFTNNDLLQASKLAENYKSKVEKVNKMGKSIIWYIDGTLRKGKVSPYKRVVLAVHKAKKYPISQKFYDQHNKLVREMKYSKVKKKGKKYIPHLIRLTPKTKNMQDEFTELTYEKIKNNIKIGDHIFTVAHLENL